MWADEAVRETWKRELLDEWGSVRAIVEDVRAGTRADRVELSREGEAVNLGPDHHARAKYLDMILKSMGMYPNPRLEIDQSTQNVLVIDSARSPLAALDPFSGTVIEGEVSEPSSASSSSSSPSSPALAYNPDGGIPPEDDFQVG